MEREVMIDNTDHTSLDIVKNLPTLLPSNDEEQESATEAFTKITTVDRMALGTDFSKESNNDNDMISLLMSTSGKDEEHIRSIVKRTVDHVNCIDGSAVTPLMVASKLGNVNVVKFLLWAGAFVNKEDYLGQSALLYTIQFFNGQIKCDGKCSLFDIPIKGRRGCLSSRMKILEELLMHGADPNIPDAAHDSTALILLAGAPLFPPCRCSGRNECYGIKLLQESCHLLLRHGAHVNIRDPSGMTALMHAVKMRFTAVCETLLEFGANINLQDNQGRSALMHGVPHLEMCTLLLLEGADVHLKSANGLTALNMVSCLDSPELCKVLIAFGADICDRGHNGKSFLMNVVQTGSSKDLAYLLDLDVDLDTGINSKNLCGKTLLMRVIEAGSQERFKDLISWGVDVDAQDYDGKTALAYAVKEDSRMWCKVLTSLTSDINMSDKQGKTNLMCAVESDSQIWALHLIEQGIDVNRQDYSGKTALMYAIQTFQQEDNASYWADLLLGTRSNVNIQDGTGKTALMYAIAFGLQHWMHSLIQSGNVDFSIRDCEGRTACMYNILFYPNVDLLRMEPRVLNTGDEDGRTVLMYAAMYSSSLFDELKRMKGVDINVCDKEGRQAADYFWRLKQDGQPRENHITLNTLFKDLHLILTTNRHASGNLQLLHKNIDMLSLHDGRCLLEPKTRLVFHDMTYWREHHNIPLDKFKPTSSLQSFIRQGKKGMVHLCVYNGVVLENRNPSSILLALSRGFSDIVKYFLATWYLTIDDMKDMLATVRAIKYKKISGRRYIGCSTFLHHSCAPVNLNSFAIAEILNEEAVDLLMEATSQPWPLVTLAFMTVSSIIGGRHDRQERISQLPLPVPLKNMLNFQREVTSCHVEDWDDIPLCFNAVEYDNLDKRRPLLYHWPIGSAWKPNQTSADD